MPRSLPVALLFLLLFAPFEAVAEPPTHGFNLPAFEQDKSLVMTLEATHDVSTNVKRTLLTIDGSTHDIPKDAKNPRAHRLRDGRALIEIEPRYYHTLYLWDPETRVLTPIRGERVAVPGLGWLILQRGSGYRSVTYHDIAPGKPALRKLWTVPLRTGGTYSTSQVIGLYKDRPLLLLKTMRGTRPEKSVERTLIHLHAPGQSTAIKVYFGSDWQTPNHNDAVRGANVLLVKHQSGQTMAPFERFYADAAVYDIETRALKPLGRINGGWSHNTSIPHAILSLKWSDHRPHTNNTFSHESVSNTVTPHTLTLRGPLGTLITRNSLPTVEPPLPPEVLSPGRDQPNTEADR